jgi:cupin fold WbuC family metalloprotein
MNVKIFSAEVLDSLISEAHTTPRMRRHLNIHQSYDDPCQRLFNAIGISSYIRPHRHSIDPKTESLFAIRGMFALILFDEYGTPRNVIRFGAESAGERVATGVELSPGDWHTVVALSEGAVLLELKAGPFNPEAAKELASWAPEEDGLQARQYLKALRDTIVEWAPCR